MTRGRSRCRKCSVRREQERLRDAPWLRLYNLPAWNKVKWNVHKRDGYRCTYTDRRGRCTATTKTETIEAHHTIKVRELYSAALGDWNKFLARALDPSMIVTLCYRHHLAADRPGSRPRAPLSARPRRRRRKPIGRTYTRDRRL